MIVEEPIADRYGFRYRDWDIYIDARKYRMEIKKLIKIFPEEEKYALSSQTNRALISIVLNIAESANRNSDKDTRVFINRAHTSLDEVVGCMDCALDDKYISVEQHDFALQNAQSLAKRLRKFYQHLSVGQ